MKRLLTYFLMATLLIVVGCSKYDDSELTGRVDNLENRVTALEELCKQMNTNITSLQTIVNALQNNDYVTSVTPIMQDGVEIGYTITFAKSDSITIYHGKNGSNGEDGYTPVIGVEKDTDGIYYWTIDGEWLTDDKGNKIKAQGIDGKDGQSGTNGEDGTDGNDGTDGSDGTNGKNGKDGITPKLKIENDYWYVSYDNGKSWEKLDKATGEDGKNGDSMFSGVTQDADNVYFQLSNGTTITIPKSNKTTSIELTYIPRYNDGKATVFYTKAEDSYVEFDFEVSPISAVADWKNISTIKAVYTQTRAEVNFVDMDILEWATNKAKGIITIKASGKNLSENFFTGKLDASARLVVSSDDINIISDYIPMVAKCLVGHNKEPYFSETVELMGLIFRLAGAPEYNQCQVPTVAESADRFFASMKDHKAVQLAKQVRNTGVAYDAVTGYANQLIFDRDGEIIFDPDYMEGSNGSFDRWTLPQKNEMLAAVNDFYKKSKFYEWFVSTRSEQQQAIVSFKSICNFDYNWLDSFYGKNDKISSRIILSFMIGWHNNGISLKRADGTFLLTPVIGSIFLNKNGVITFDEGHTYTVVHEFSHPYCNPLIDANWSLISSKANEIYSKVSDKMVSMAYGRAEIMMYETFVRSCVIRYMISHNQTKLADQMIKVEEERGFVLVKTLVKTLEKREQEAGKYPTMADFMPEIVAAINQFDPNRIGMAEPDTLPKEYVDLGIVMDNGKKLYFATRNVGETSPAGFGTNVYRWGAVIEGGVAWNPPSGEIWPTGKKLDADHDIATITWGEEWHTPSVAEWNLLVEKCDYERKEANESGYGVAGYFFYNKADHSKFIFLPVSSNNELRYWTSQIKPYIDSATGKEYTMAQVFNSYNGDAMCGTTADLNSSNVAVRPVCVK